MQSQYVTVKTCETALISKFELSTIWRTVSYNLQARVRQWDSGTDRRIIMRQNVMRNAALVWEDRLKITIITSIITKLDLLLICCKKFHHTHLGMFRFRDKILIWSQTSTVQTFTTGHTQPYKDVHNKRERVGGTTFDLFLLSSIKGTREILEP